MKIIKSAERYGRPYRTNTVVTERGYIVEHDGARFFVQADEISQDDTWQDIERKYCYDEICDDDPWTYA